jgi:hypothetical protein
MGRKCGVRSISDGHRSSTFGAIQVPQDHKQEGIDPPLLQVIVLLPEFRHEPVEFENAFLVFRNEIPEGR